MKCKYENGLNEYNFCEKEFYYCTLQKENHCKMKHSEYFEEDKTVLSEVKHMTNEEALEQLKINGTKEPLEISGSPTRMANYFKALDIASKVIKKQIEMKPKKIEIEGYRYVDTYKCPTCKGNFSGTGIADYCYHCGQKLDWSEVE